MKRTYWIIEAESQAHPGRWLPLAQYNLYRDPTHAVVAVSQLREEFPSLEFRLLPFSVDLEDEEERVGNSVKESV